MLLVRIGLTEQMTEELDVQHIALLCGVDILRQCTRKNRRNKEFAKTARLMTKAKGYVGSAEPIQRGKTNVVFFRGYKIADMLGRSGNGAP